MKTVCIISDTHGSLSSKTLGCLCGCDYIIHAGDIGNPSFLIELNNIAPVSAVLGNNDFDCYPSDVKYETLYVEIGRAHV